MTNTDEYVTSSARRRAAWERDVAKGKELEPTEFPSLWTISSALFFQFQAVPSVSMPSEYVYITPSSSDVAFTEQAVFVAQWNACWESAQARADLFWNKIPDTLAWLRDTRNRNIMLAQHGVPFPYAHTPMLHMLPVRICRYYGIPPFRRGFWPHSLRQRLQEEFVPSGFGEKLSKAFAYYIWPLLNKRSKIESFTQDDPIRVLSHNLDYWLPYVEAAITERIAEYGRCEPEDAEQEQLLRRLNEENPRVEVVRPLFGGPVWMGEEEAWEIASRVVELADARGNLRAIIDEIHSNRVDDDFSDRWSFEREDFERKLYRKRNKTKVKFVELTDTIPTHGPESDVVDSVFWEDFIATLDRTNREIVVLLRSGHTNLSDIAERLGYANHSAVSKRLNKIRNLVARELDN